MLKNENARKVLVTKAKYSVKDKTTFESPKYPTMKKFAAIALLLSVLFSSCTQYTCPTYTKGQNEKGTGGKVTRL